MLNTDLHTPSIKGSSNNVTLRVFLYFNFKHRFFYF
jgi:Sec7-like guanine-nucleotide exchange factor